MHSWDFFVMWMIILLFILIYYLCVRFCNVWVRVDAGFVMCVSFGNMLTCIYCVLYCLCCVLCTVSLIYTFSYLFCLYCYQVSYQLQLIIMTIIIMQLFNKLRPHNNVNLRWTDIYFCLECTASPMFAYEFWNGKLNDKPTILCVRW
jgi:hypothetical protein